MQKLESSRRQERNCNFRALPVSTADALTGYSARGKFLRGYIEVNHLINFGIKHVLIALLFASAQTKNSLKGTMYPLNNKYIFHIIVKVLL